MRFNNSIRIIPIISTLLLILFFSISNQKENTKLRLLIWNTPSFSLGSYIAISTSTGFILGYSINLIISKLILSPSKQQFTNKFNEQNTQINYDLDKQFKHKYDNTLIERDIKDPSPTIKADFRIISRNEYAYNENLRNKIQEDDLFQNEEQYSEKSAKNKESDNESSNLIDWFDQSFSDW